MNNVNFYVRYALRSLRRDSTRTGLAILCVAFGVLSLVSMQLLAHTLLNGMQFDQRLSYGGDAIVQSPKVGEPLTAAELAQIETWREQGLITAYTPVSNGSGTFLRTEDNARVHFLSWARGVDFSSYPLFGDFALREPVGKTPAEVLREPTDALLTRDTADELGLQVGDTFLISGNNTVPTRLTLAGIVGATPNQTGDSLYYSLTTAQTLEDRSDIIDEVILLWGTAPNAEETVVGSPLQVWVATTDRLASSGADVFDLMLKGAGVLGLLVGGIGVSNTLQVILARRKLEIAMLKTVGYQRAALLLLIGLETGLIGIVGGVLGAVAGSVLTQSLIDILSRNGTLMMAWSPDPVIVIGGIMSGSVAAVVFGLQVIVATSATRPITLLRDLPYRTPAGVIAGHLILYICLMLVLGLLIGIVLGSVIQGIGLMLVGSAVLVVLRLLFWGVLWITLKLPIPPLPLLRLARRGLIRRKMQSTLAVLALSAGAFAVTFAAMVVFSSQAKMLEIRGSDDGYNLLIYTVADKAPDAVGVAVAQGAAAVYTSYPFAAVLDSERAIIEGRVASDLSAGLQLTSGTWTATADTILLNALYQQHYAIGDMITLTNDDRSYALTVTGFFDVDANTGSNIDRMPSAIVIPDLAFAFGGEQNQAHVVASFPVDRLRSTADAVGAALPDMLVFSKADINDQMVSAYQALFSFAVSIAGLAFVAGAILIANSTGLAVVERRREIGVLKAVGYTSGQVMRLLIGEYGFLGILSGVLGVIGVAIVIGLLRVAQPGMPIEFEPMIAMGMIALSLAIALISAAIVIWQPARIRPLEVLRYE